MSALHISVIIPVRNDSVELESLLASMPPAGDTELVVANGGRRDRRFLALAAARPDVRWVEAQPGRGVQMNAGVRASSGNWLVFLHADARLHREWRAEVTRAGAHDDVVGGAFHFALRSDARAARRIERFVAWRVRRFGLPYGDQALFVRRDVFAQMGGYPDWPLFEDLDLVRRLRKVGRLWASALPVEVSARRWEREGWWSRSAQNLGLLALYFAGVPPARLARWYDRASRERAA